MGGKKDEALVSFKGRDIPKKGEETELKHGDGVSGGEVVNGQKIERAVRCKVRKPVSVKLWTRPLPNRLPRNSALNLKSNRVEKSRQSKRRARNRSRNG
jgi:hypothetical protein